MQSRFIIVFLVAVFLVGFVVAGCGTESTNNSADDSFRIEFDENGVPIGTPIETLEDGRRRWKHGDHYHYIREDSEEPELKSDTIIRHYLFEIEADNDCVMDKLNIDEDFLDMNLLDFVKVLGLETIDIEQVIKSCLKSRD